MKASTKDPRGLIVVFSASMVRHASDHWSSDEQVTIENLVNTCSDPDFITTNHGNSVNPRKGDELYCRAVTGSAGHILVPAKRELVRLPDGSEAEAMTAFTCYIAAEAPLRRRLWFRKA